MKIVGIEGIVSFELERYKSGGDYFSETGQFKYGSESQGVKDLIEAEIQTKSYNEVSSTLERVSGTRLYSGNHVSEKVKDYAKQHTEDCINNYAGVQLSLPFGASDVNIYDKSSEETLVFDDAIGVNRQKEERKAEYKKRLSRVQTEVIEVQRPNGTFEYITAGYGVKNWSLESALLCWLCATYGNRRLPIVALSDGAREIRLRLWRVFGGQVIILLDWYHLHRKIWDFMSMLAKTKSDKEEGAKKILGLLWVGLTQEAILYICEFEVRNEAKRKELVHYLTKHSAEIIDYKRRKEAGKVIGTGRAEKGVDMVVAQRQKNKPIAWSENGSHALSTLRAKALNIARAA